MCACARVHVRARVHMRARVFACLVLFKQDQDTPSLSTKVHARMHKCKRADMYACLSTKAILPSAVAVLASMAD